MERRRKEESERKERIFNTKLRVMGVDIQALEQQMQEKKHLQNMARQRDRAYDSLRLLHDEELMKQDCVEKQRRADLESDLTKYWATFQRVEDSRDADLKCDLKGAMRLPVPESQLGPASMQIFKGEDRNAEYRRKEQMKITARDLGAQKDKNERRRMGDRQKDILAGKELMYDDHRGVEMRALEEECKRASRMALDNYNHALAAEQGERLQEQRRHEERENLAEIWHTVTSDMMTERAEAAETPGSGKGPPKVLTDRWKGMSPAQLNAIHKERDKQCVEKQKQQDKEKTLHAGFGLQLLMSSKAAEEEEQRTADLRRQKRAEMDQYNMMLAKEQQIQQEYLDKVLYTNKPTEDYFHQFTTCSR